MGKYKTYNKEFKIEAIRLLEQFGKSGSEIAREMGIKRNQPYKQKLQARGKAGRLLLIIGKPDCTKGLSAG